MSDFHFLDDGADPVPTDPVEILREFAKCHGVRASSVHDFDANVCHYTYAEDKPWEFIILEGEPFTRELQYSDRGKRIKLFANANFLNCSVEGCFAVEPLSVNKKNAVNPQLKEAGLVAIGSRLYRVFTETGSLEHSQRDLLTDAEFTRLMDDINLDTQESIHLTWENVSAYFYHPTLVRATRAIEGFMNLALARGTQKKLDLTVLPKQFHPLIPRIEKWAIGDDSDREDFLTSQPKVELETFVQDVEPFLSQIDSYLDSLGDQALPLGAIMLGRLAECALEAKRYLAEKKNHSA